LHFPLAQSVSPTQVAHTLALQRALLHEASSAQASPFLSLQKPAPQLPLKQSASCAQASAKCALFCAATQSAIPSQIAAFVQKLGRSSTPSGSFEHMPICPGTAQDRQAPEQVAAQAGGGWHKSGMPEQRPVAQSPGILHFCCGAAALHVAPQEPPQSKSVSSASWTPSAQCVETQAPSPLQTMPPFSLQAKPRMRLATLQVWLCASQAARLHVDAGTAQSVSAKHWTHLPLPSQT
jgi:hypothetical protein